jgi:hypothetical protein
MAETLFRQWFVEEARDDWEEGDLKLSPQKLLMVLINHLLSISMTTPMATVKVCIIGALIFKLVEI